jgi:glutathione peroxidase
MMSKIVVKGKDQHPLYAFLTSKEHGGAFAGDVEWNFAKFLLGKDGKVAGRFPAKLSPEDPKVLDAIEVALNLTPAQVAALPPLPRPATRPTTAPATQP